MKITYEIDTESENYNPFELWEIQRAQNMFNVLANIYDKLHDKWKWAEDRNTNWDTLYDEFISILHDNNLKTDDLI